MKTRPLQARLRVPSRMRPAGMRSSLLTARPRCGVSANLDCHSCLRFAESCSAKYTAYEWGVTLILNAGQGRAPCSRAHYRGGAAGAHS